MLRVLRTGLLLAALVASAVLAGCWIDKMPLPPVPENEGLKVVSDTVYVQLKPVWSPETGWDFLEPADVLVGREPLIYVADTGHDRVVMLDLAGNVLGVS